jgi:BirA family biotin operon repressor/biotin-[acetyl-CoA-carboxylase] ligase
VNQPGMHMALSIIIQPDNMTASQLPILSMKTSLGLVRILKQANNALHPLIKWPNDIYANGKKIAGILIENSLSSSKVQHCIIGIGMNVNEPDFPDDLPNATSLFMLTKKKYDIKKLAEEVRLAVMQILNEKSEMWKSEYDGFMYGSGQIMSFEEKGELVSARVLGVDFEGRIILEKEDGIRKSYFAHEIKWLI